VYREKQKVQKMYARNPNPPLADLLFKVKEHCAVMDRYQDNLEDLLMLLYQRSRLVLQKIFV